LSIPLSPHIYTILYSHQSATTMIYTRSLHDALPIYVRIKNIYLYSNSPGTGKTTTASAILNEFIRRRFLYLASKKRLSIAEAVRSEEHTSELQSRFDLVCRLLLEKKTLGQL